MDISKYTAFFHDGSIIDIKHVKNSVEFSLASSEMYEEDVEDSSILSKDHSIQGKLHLEGIISITINHKPSSAKLMKMYDRGRIFDFEITKNSIEISIDWRNFPPKPVVNEFSVIKIEAENIWWKISLI